MVVKIKLASNFQTLEFDLDVPEEEDGLTGEKRLNFRKHSQLINDAVAMVERIGSIVTADTKSGKTTKKEAPRPAESKVQKIQEEKPASERQIYALKEYGIDARGMTQREAWEELNAIKKGY